MGTIRNGGNGAFSGKAGSFIGSSWNGVDYIKGIPKLSKKPASPKQLEVQAKFKLVTRFMAPLREVLALGWQGQTYGKQTIMNAAVQQVLQEAVLGDYPLYELNYPRILVAKGTYATADSPAAMVVTGGGLTISWTDIGAMGSEPDDKAIIVLYNPAKNKYIGFNQLAVREDLSVDIQLPLDFEGEDIHIWLFFISRDNGRRSNSIHLGPVVPIT